MRSVPPAPPSYGVLQLSHILGVQGPELQYPERYAPTPPAISIVQSLLPEYTMSSKKMGSIIALFVVALVFFSGCTQSTVPDKALTLVTTQTGTPVATTSVTTTGTPPVTPAASLDTTSSIPTPVQARKQVKLETTMGDITIALDPDMPITAGNFESLVKSGYYNGVMFHRVINGFMIQGGDPTGTGRGGPGTGSRMSSQATTRTSVAPSQWQTQDPIPGAPSSSSTLWITAPGPPLMPVTRYSGTLSGEWMLWTLSARCRRPVHQMTGRCRT